MNKSKMAGALNAISVGFGELAEAIMEEGVAPVLAAPSTLSVEPPWTQEAAAMPDFPPSEYEDLPVAATPQTETVLGRCPKHDLAWTVKPAGVSKTGKPYSAFWKCAGRDDDGFCNRKPVKAWADAHPAERAA